VSPGFAPNGMGIVLPAGRIQFLTGGPARDSGFSDPQALAVVSYRSGSSSMAGARMTFDQIEPRVVADAVSGANSTSGSFVLPNGATGSATLVASSPTMAVRNDADGQAPVRVGGQVHTPHKTHDVPVVYPEAMRQSGVAGIVILELIIAADGSVSGAKVLRGLLPQIDLAALEAAKQWRYEPTLLQGKPVPVVLTAPVAVKP
jgi:TonB family protein